MPASELESDPYLPTCEVTVTVFDGNDENKTTDPTKGKLVACGQPAVNGFLCAEHSRRARMTGAEEALLAAYGCAPCAKVIVRGYDADGVEYRMLHFYAEEASQAQDMLMMLVKFNERAKKQELVIARGPFVFWQDAFEVEEAGATEKESGHLTW